MDGYAEFKIQWNEHYDGECDQEWLSTVCPAIALFRPLDKEFLYIDHVRSEDHDFFEEFNNQYGCDPLFIWTNFYHWKDDGGYSQPSFGELRDFIQLWEPKVHAVSRAESNVDAWNPLPPLDTTPTSRDINAVLEMCGIEVKVRITYFLYLYYIIEHSLLDQVESNSF